MENRIAQLTDNASIPKSISRQVTLGHIGTIFSNLAIFCLILSLGGVISFFLYVVGVISLIMIAVVMIMLIICTLGIILAIVPSFWSATKYMFSLVSKSGEIIDKFGNLIGKAWPIITPLAIAFALASVLLLVFDKTQKHTKRKVFSCVVLALSVVVLIVLIAGGKI